MNTNPALFGVAAIVILGMAIGQVPAHGQQGPAPAVKTAADASEYQLQAASANVKQPGSPVKIRIFRWSTDEERNSVIAALNPPATAGAPDGAAPAPATARRGGAGRGAGGRGGAGRGGRGAALSPIAALTAAIGAAPTIGFIWTDEVAGYAVKYAVRAGLPTGGERIVLATNRRLGGYTAGWRPLAASPLTDYEFTVIEIRLDSKGVGEGKASLVTPVVVDAEARIVALENYGAAPPILQNVKH
jgi:hypothetical protein